MLGGALAPVELVAVGGALALDYRGGRGQHRSGHPQPSPVKLMSGRLQISVRPAGWREIPP